MTISEYKMALESKDEEAFSKFQKSFGGNFTTRQQYVDDFVRHPDHERHICQLLGLPTQEERQTEAIIKSSQAALESAKLARLAVIFAAIGVIVSVIALVLARKGLS